MKRSAAIDNVLMYAGGCFASEDFKRRNILEYFKEYGSEIFIETGTNYGETSKFMVPYAKEIHTIELSEKLHKNNLKKFENDDNVHCYCGDSKDIIGGILEKFPDIRVLIYLDAHYSGGVTAHGDKNTPIIEELEIISKANLTRPLVILIDDARLFGFDADYPSLFKLKLFIQSHFENSEFEVYNDVIRIVCK